MKGAAVYSSLRNSKFGYATNPTDCRSVLISRPAFEGIGAAAVLANGTHAELADERSAEIGRQPKLTNASPPWLVVRNDLGVTSADALCQRPRTVSGERRAVVVCLIVQEMSCRPSVGGICFR